MDVRSIGGGPGGLFASLLLKKANPDWEVQVYEREEPGVTYGWGIVFPGRALSNIEDADSPTYDTLTDACELWEPFDTYLAGERYRCNGHTFSSIMRTDLLDILQDRCKALGVELEFGREVERPEEVAAKADLVIAADGINSSTRETYGEEFGTTNIEGKSVFSWFGTEQQFDALSHIFVENEEGLWCAHTYPGPVNTFIVDCDAKTWENARLDELTEEEYLTYLEEVFAEYLNGHKLLSQIERWQRFRTVKNGTWHHDNIVLLGDAAATAHYSIGSGTSLAFESAIALAGAFEDYFEEADPERSLERALTTFEDRRRPEIEALQTVGERSRIHFENIRRYIDEPSWQFTLHHLTRSGRLSRDSLAARDPEFAAAVDEEFAETRGDPSLVDADVEPRHHPFELREVTYPTRQVRVLPSMASTEGMPSRGQLKYVRQILADDDGLVLTGPLAVTPEGRPDVGAPGIYRDEHVHAFELLTEAVEEAAVGAHLIHAGARAGMEPRVFGLGEPMPREDAWSPRRSEQTLARRKAYQPGNVSASDRKRIVEAFKEGARRADQAGFDHLQVHAGHRTLLSAFLSPETNGRTDEYGGSLSNRIRFPREVVEAIRTVWSAEKPLGVTLQAVDWTADGLALTEGIEIAGALAEAGCDIVAPVAGGTGAPEDPSPVKGVSNCSDDIRNGAGVPTLATPFTTSADKVNTLIASGRADLCVFAGETATDD